jgi:ferric-dicitrate binding protein FerR (iron transport regulator)
MQSKKEYIEILIQKFKNEEITSSELDRLHEILNQEDVKGELAAVFYKQWNEISSKNNYIDKVGAFEKVKERLDMSIDVEAESQDKTANKNKIFLTILKYAAVVLVTITMTLLVQFFMNKEIVKQEQVVYQEYNVPNGSKSHLTLPDGTEIWLNSGSKLRYAVIFENKERQVFLEGEAYFSVSEDKTRPFIVNTDKLNVRALGTEFNVKSYPDDNVVEATLISGVISVERKTNSTSTNDIILNPNERVSFTKSTGKMKHFKPQEPQPETVIERIENKEVTLNPLPTTYIEQFVGWKEDKLIFNTLTFKDLMVKLERWYGVNIEIQNEDLTNYTFTGSFENETLQQALDALKLTTPFKYSIDKQKVLIK